MNKHKKKPLAIVLVLCAVMVVAAIIMNAMLRDYEEKRSQPDNLVEPVAVDPYASAPETPAATAPLDEYASPEAPVISASPAPVQPESPAPVQPESPAPSASAEHGYRVFKEDISWTGAQEKCAALGGHLVVIRDNEELEEVIRLAEEAGISRIWVGCHRVNGEMVWETGEAGILPWASGEPTYIDANDRVAEDYIMLWNNRGWAYNDNRDDPCADYPEFYSGTMGYICEFEDAAA